MLRLRCFSVVTGATWPSEQSESAESRNSPHDAPSNTFAQAAWELPCVLYTPRPKKLRPADRFGCGSFATDCASAGPLRLNSAGFTAIHILITSLGPPRTRYRHHDDCNF